MQNDSYEAILAAIDPDEVARICQDLVRLKTINPPGDERPAAEYVAGFLRPLGFAITFIEQGENRASLIARLPGTGALPAVVFSGHLDVVPVGVQAWRYEPFSGHVAEGRVWGRGASDMKSGVAALLVAARAIAEAGLPLRGDLIVAATAGEESDMSGATLVAAHPALASCQAAFVAEPTLNTIGLAERGVLQIRLTTHGQTAHGSTPELGQNAITMMLSLLSELDHLSVPYTPHPVLGKFTRSVNTIAGGVKVNVIPDSCTVDIDQRTVPGQDHKAIAGQLEALIAEMERRDPAFRATLEVTHDLPAVETSPDQAPVRVFEQAVARATGKAAQYQTVRFATEAAIFVPALGVPTIIFGPGDPSLAHQPEEWAGIQAMADAARVFTLAATELLG